MLNGEGLAISLDVHRFRVSEPFKADATRSVFQVEEPQVLQVPGGVLFPASQLASPSHLLKHKHLEKRLVPDCILLIQQHKPAKSPRKIIPQNPFETAKNASETPVLAQSIDVFSPRGYKM